MEYGVYGDLIIVDPKPYSIYFRGLYGSFLQCLRRLRNMILFRIPVCETPMKLDLIPTGIRVFD